MGTNYDAMTGNLTGSYGNVPIELFEIEIDEDTNNYLRLVDTPDYPVALSGDTITEYNRFPITRDAIENRFGLDEIGAFTLRTANFDIESFTGSLSVTGESWFNTGSYVSGGTTGRITFLSDLLEENELRGKKITVYFALVKYTTGGTEPVTTLTGDGGANPYGWLIPSDYWCPSFIGVIESVSYSEEIITVYVKDMFGNISFKLPRRLHTFLCPWKYLSKQCIRGDATPSQTVCRKTFRDCVDRWADSLGYDPDSLSDDELTASKAEAETHFGGFLHLGDIQTKRISGY